MHSLFTTPDLAAALIAAAPDIGGAAVMISLARRTCRAAAAIFAASFANNEYGGSIGSIYGISVVIGQNGHIVHIYRNGRVVGGGTNEIVISIQGAVRYNHYVGDMEFIALNKIFGIRRSAYGLVFYVPKAPPGYPVVVHSNGHVRTRGGEYIGYVTGIVDRPVLTRNYYFDGTTVYYSTYFMRNYPNFVRLDKLTW